MTNQIVISRESSEPIYRKFRVLKNGERVAELGWRDNKTIQLEDVNPGDRIQVAIDWCKSKPIIIGDDANSPVHIKVRPRMEVFKLSAVLSLITLELRNYMLGRDYDMILIPLVVLFSMPLLYYLVIKPSKYFKISIEKSSDSK